jgi:hypothetical protein
MKRPPSPSRAAKACDQSGTPDGYTVGYCRPPMHSRFKPGQSGNRKGRPRGRKNMRTILDNVLQQPVTIHEGGKPRTVTKKEALLLKWVHAALANDPKAAAVVFPLLRATGHFDEDVTAADAQLLPPERANALAVDYFERNLRSEPRRSRAQAKGGRRR